jgi:hypothetical protein
MSSLHAVDDSTSDTMDDCRTAAPDESGLLRARFLDDATGLLAVEVSTPVPVALALLDVLNRFGVSMTAYEVDKRGCWALFLAHGTGWNVGPGRETAPAPGGGSDSPRGA